MANLQDNSLAGKTTPGYATVLCEGRTEMGNDNPIKAICGAVRGEALSITIPCYR